MSTDPKAFTGLATSFERIDEARDVSFAARAWLDRWIEAAGREPNALLGALPLKPCAEPVFRYEPTTRLPKVDTA